MAADGPALEHRLRSVVLLLARLEDGRTGYGAGVVIDGRGHALTALHFLRGAASIDALWWRSDRRAYTPMEGGLERTIAERRDELTPATLELSDPDLDLAVVRLAADTSCLPRIPRSEGPARLGERVLAIGHPSEAPWSLSAGIVSSLPSGLIQHDAPLGAGSSGGPLLDAEGRWLGVNTQKLLDPAEGIGYARPLGAARHLLERALAAHPEPRVAASERSACEALPKRVSLVGPR
jgi:S1-C subfamily serine protease